MSSNTRLIAALEESIREACGNGFRIEDAGALAGQCAAESFNTRVAGHGQRLMVKFVAGHAADRLAAEVDGLAALSRSSAFRVPAPIALGRIDTHAWLALEWLDLRPLDDAASATRAAEALAELHALEGEHFGWHRDNYIGATAQGNAQSDNWSRFFALQRLAPQFQSAAAKAYGSELKRDGELIVASLPALFLDHRVRPSLLHGDLWHGNIAQLPDGTPALFDPATYYGDRESDIAMSELFGGLPDAFYVAYRRAMPLSPDYETRKLAYNLYHMLNHLQLFGRGYLSQTCRMARTLRQLLGR